MANGENEGLCLKLQYETSGCLLRGAARGVQKIRCRQTLPSVRLHLSKEKPLIETGKGA